jgi:hypothetical protein
LGHNVGGLEYEKKIRNCVKQVNLNNVKLLSDNGGFNCNDVDLQLLINGKNTNFEVKCKDAQMGESSYSYLQNRSPKFVPTTEKADPDISDIIISELKNMEGSILELFDYLKQQEPVHYHCPIDGLPLRVTKRAWTRAISDKKILPINARIQFDERIIEHHYNTRNVFYIQIEDLGLFYLKENPLNLPIPRLQGNVLIEVRLKRGGSSLLKSIGENAATVVLRASGRLKFKGKSEYSLDCPEKISKLFSEVS